MDEAYIEMLVKACNTKGITLIGRKEISYGVQLRFDTGEATENLRVYQNSKGKITLDVSALKTDKMKSACGDFREELSPSAVTAVKPPLIGSDEAGKGDYFGPLCVCALYADTSQYNKLKELNVRDSKLMSDGAIHKMSLEIKRVCPAFEIVQINNERFNEMYASMKNMNNLLGWAHSSAIKTLLNRVACENVLVDKFGNESWISERLKANAGVKLTQIPKAEANPAVAAASILARDAFVTALNRMSKAYDLELPLGAGENVDTAAKELLAKIGEKEMRKAVKMNFRNSERVF